MREGVILNSSTREFHSYDTPAEEARPQATIPLTYDRGGT